MTGERAKVSVLVPVKNEEANIAACLDSLRWAGEVFVVDSQSTDDTARLAEAAGAQVVQFHYQGGDKKKNWSLANLPFRNEWVLIIDADERVPPELAEEIRESIERPGGPDGYYVNRRLIFLGRWIRHAGWYPSWNLRLFRHRLGRYETVDVISPQIGDNEVHEHVILQGRAGYLRHDLLHHDYKSLFHYLERHNRYSDWDSAVYLDLRRQPLFVREPFHGAVRRKRLLKRLWVRLPFRPLLLFVYMYVLRLGFLDGAAGLHFCLLSSMHQYHISLKVKERLAKES
ncbi:MAG TPA: glycosyltransferase family 2 protein [Bryobacterales bacterium]|nr:glycosyltransferase family 2 protein [Bryobacterales bacterium]